MIEEKKTYTSNSGSTSKDKPIPNATERRGNTNPINKERKLEALLLFKSLNKEKILSKAILNKPTTIKSKNSIQEISPNETRIISVTRYENKEIKEGTITLISNCLK